ncbi:hypothetical protein PENTCL1PPCAC_5470 [Pristionchus entomophagus]|uniref:Uncharacterized protein n=1 Tax=Pristionchus entomophagus TaxID=358040 RepID=A0AAV5ST98_9BILA|nr:hypothetical protein PENTCL1PPCAC_5470 [Pristionchus entomophagus]
MTADIEVASNEEDEPYQHCCCCCEMHVDKAVRVLGVIYFIVELYAVWDHISDKNPTFPICFAAITGLLVYGIWKKQRTAILVFQILLALVLLVECGMFIYEIPLVTDAWNKVNEKPKVAQNTTTQSPEADTPKEIIIATIITFVHLIARIFVGGYLFKVLHSFRQYILEEEENQETPAAPIPLYTLRAPVEDPLLQTPPPAYTSAD